MKKTMLLYLILVTIIGNAQKSPFNGLEIKNDSTGNYSFFVSGHFHGSGANRTGYPTNTLLANLDQLNNSESEFLVCLGDLFLDVSNDIPFFEASLFSQLKIPLFNTVGNHDLTKDIYQKKYGETNFSFRIGKDLHLFFDTETDNGSFNSDQLNTLKTCVAQINKGQVKKVFIYCHRTIWVKHYSSLNGLFSDNTQSVLGNNFSSEVHPLLQEIAELTPVYWFSGSLGDAPASFFYHEDNDITYIATAIRGLKRDAWLKVSVKEEELPSFKTISLTGQTMFNLKDYDVEFWNSNSSEEPFNYRLLYYLFKRMIFHHFFWIGVITALSFVFLIRRWLVKRKLRNALAE
ncbi:MAG: hypothetical protein AB8B74_02895 [Crocinitomicaceae bacterium]